jgi:hypothetical protein
MEIAKMTASTLPEFDQSFESALTEFLKGKKRVSPWMYSFLRALVFLFTSCAVMMAASYAVQLGETPLFKGVIIATAVGIELAVVFFSAVIYPKWFLKLNQILAGTLLPILSVFTIMSFMVSQQFAQDHKVEEMAKTYTEELQDSAKSLSITESSSRASLQITRDRIEGMLDKLSGVEGSKATAVYHYLSKLFGVNVETIVLLIRGLWSLCFVTLCIALDAFVDLRLYSKKQLDIFINDWHEEQDLLDSAREKAEERRVKKGSLSTENHTVKSDNQGAIEKEKGEGFASFRAERSPRGETFDIGVTGDNASRFERVKERVRSGEVRATIRGLKSLGMSQLTAEKYLRQLKSEGVGYVNGHA